MSPEQTAVEAIVRGWVRAEMWPDSLDAKARMAIESISAAELLIVPAGRMARLLEVERAARALEGADVQRGAVRGTDYPTITLMLPEGEYDRRDEAADALVAALVEVVA
jgi:hypothetical protein